MIAGLVVLLAALGLLQYRWMTQISASEGEKARVRVREQAERFAQDFNREIQNAYFNFQTEAQTWKSGDWSAFNERYEFWQANSEHPALITGFTYLPAEQAGALTYDRETKGFQVTENNDEIGKMRSRLGEAGPFRPVDTANHLLYLPIHESEKRLDVMIRRTEPPNGEIPKIPATSVNMPKVVGHLVIRLDPEVLKNNVVGDLGAKYFADGEYRFAIKDEKGNAVHQEIAGEPDASAPLFDLAPDNFIFFTNKDLMKKISGEEKQAAIVSSHVESRTFNEIRDQSNSNGEIKVAIRKESKPRTSVFTMTARTDGGATNPWTLAVQHSSGSLDGYIASTLQRNLAIGFGILFLLAAAVAAIIISSLRARALAQRQIDFVSSVSHEFRTPLAVIYSAAENLADGVAKETVQVSRYGDLIKGEGRKLSAMVEQILEFAGANSGKRKFSFRPTPVADVVNDAVAESRSLIDDRGFQIETDISDTLPTISVDKNALSQAIQNLIGNSIKYSKGEAWIRVSANNGNGKVKISVEDRGIGISKGDLKKIFEPFYRSKEVVDAQIHGNGLGLSLVQQIAEAHGGRAFAISELGRGSKFTVELPVAAGVRIVSSGRAD